MANKTSKTINYRYVIIVVLTFILLQLIYLSVNKKSALTNLNKTVSKFDERIYTIDKIDQSFAYLFDIENNFRIYLNTRQSQYFQEYKDGLLALTANIDSIQQYKKDNFDQKKSDENLKSFLKVKQQNANIFIRLKAINDSLFLVIKNVEEVEQGINLYYKPFKIKDIQTLLSQKADTAININKPISKGLMSRLGDALANKKVISADTIINNNRILEHTKYVQDSLALAKINKLFKQTINALIINQDAIKIREKAINEANGHLLAELSSLLITLKNNEVEAQKANTKQLSTTAKAGIGLIDRDGEYILILSLILAAIIVFNIWHLHKYEQELKLAERNAVNQTKQKSAYLAHLSHEIRTPLNAIIGFSDQLVKPEVEKQEKEVYLIAVKESSQMLLSLVNDILDFSKLETGEFTLHSINFKPHKSVSEVLRTLVILATQKKLSLKAEFSFGEDLTLFGDEYRFKQVLINLINNAIKFTDKGSITVLCKLTHPTTVCLEVIDTGVGIKIEDFKVLFNEFSQLADDNLENKKIGSGLGLSITKTIVEAQGGSINVESVFGHGAKFIVEIPYQPEHYNEASQKKLDTEINLSATQNKVVNKIKKVLIVDDNLLNIKLLKIILEKKLIICDSAENGKLAYELFLNNQYDVVLTDIEMPIMDGVELTKKIRLNSDDVKSQTPILAITANAVLEDLNEYTAVGMNGHVLKPFNEQTLFESLNKLEPEDVLIN